LATPASTLDDLCYQLISAGVDRILSEKPLALKTADATELHDFARRNGTEVRIAYNRRHYQSVAKAREVIKADGGATSFYMDFTEALFRIDPDAYADEVLRRWGIANSSHVIDTAFHLCGLPETLEAYQAGGDIDWHPSSSLFYGSGVTTQDVHFAYHANWTAPGRWRIEVNTPNRKLLFSPMERLQIQPSDSFAVEEVDIDYSLDEAYKPGFYRQTQAFLTGSDGHLLPLADLKIELDHLEEIFGY
jgi:predicted dehydrogenase